MLMVNSGSSALGSRVIAAFCGEIRSGLHVADLMHGYFWCRYVLEGASIAVVKPSSLGLV